jgi:hypothetical protein
LPAVSELLRRSALELAALVGSGELSASDRDQGDPGGGRDAADQRLRADVDLIAAVSGDDGLPTAVQLIAPPAGKGLLLSLAAQLARALPWADRNAPGYT